MSRVLAAPSAGQPVSASLFADILREIRANRPLPGVNTRTIRTPNGTHISAVGGAAGHASKAKDVGCFFIREIRKEHSSGQQVRQVNVNMGNPFFRVAGKTYRLGTAEDDSDDQEVTLTDPGIIALKINADGNRPSGSTLVYGSWSDLLEDEADEMHVVIPLYWFDDSFNLICDFRNAPFAGTWEVAR